MSEFFISIAKNSLLIVGVGMGFICSIIAFNGWKWLMKSPDIESFFTFAGFISAWCFALATQAVL